ncbi:elongation factor P maturation arginine rhamnosyltransferase EarP [Methylovorus menthalis]|uniref:elongation factor P maturation arginine rhamnosyltransferase EarP n=1 Tax=Methylovorus menthalis TaxID=1002227 RepID=UPI001E4ACE1D|nr:elongation factor P maturation arginine rhamnosyltransferase EarP [Methylovorus menthalis]MCB4811888.1 elongation factor P maturation arginine rhamnosyltransferase EarP [Methylovorus menthalis]
MTDKRQRWDIFCRIVDNYGDIGVCWRLARQLAHEYSLDVRLWVDTLPVAQRLLPALDTQLSEQVLDGVTIAHWSPEFQFDRIADVVIEAFACELPEPYINAMVAHAPVWINLEYLSAEAWVEEFHLQPSPHPRLALKKTFFFPGFTENTGGLLRERRLMEDRDTAPALSTAAFSMAVTPANALRVSLFAYPQASLAALFTAMANGDRPVACLIPESSLLAPVSQFFGTEKLLPGDHYSQGTLSIHILPFLSQAQYDQLLWSCDLNFVRGEDSWIRAIWAGRPFIWQPYIQSEDTHLVKLEAFLQRYLPPLQTEAADVWRSFHRQWAQLQLAAESWPQLVHALPAIQQHAKQQSQALAAQDDLAAKLVIFVRNFQ